MSSKTAEKLNNVPPANIDKTTDAENTKDDSEKEAAGKTAKQEQEESTETKEKERNENDDNKKVTLSNTASKTDNRLCLLLG